MKLDEMVLRWDARRRPSDARWGSAPTPFTLGFVILMAVAAPLAALLLPASMEGELIRAGSETPVLCVRDSSAVEQAKALRDGSYADPAATLRCRTADDR